MEVMGNLQTCIKINDLFPLFLKFAIFEISIHTYYGIYHWHTISYRESTQNQMNW